MKHTPLLVVGAAALLFLELGCKSPWSPINRRQVLETNIVQSANGLTTNIATNQVYEVNPAYTKGIDTARQANKDFNPTVFGPAVDVGLGVLSGALALIAAWKNKQHAQATQLLETVIQGVEKAPAAAAAEVKTSVQNVSEIKGTRTELAAAVDKVTKPAAA